MYSGGPDPLGHHANEPMMMGSPTSPTSPLPGHQSQCLPGYLLGDSFSTPSSRLWTSTSHSPPRSVQRLGSLTSPNSSALGNMTPRLETSMRGKDKSGAPPTLSLQQIASPAPPVAQSPFSTPAMMQSRGFHTPGTQVPPTTGFSHNLHDSIYGTPGGDSSFHMSRTLPTSPAQLDPFHTQGDSLTAEDVASLDSTWVTVFGFPPAAASFVLQQFSQYGNILKCVTSTDGNWIHLHYQSKIQAKKALSKNGKVLGNSIMVGVTPCIDMKAMEDDKENDVNGTNGGNLTQPLTPSVGSATPGVGGRHTPIRPLTAAYRAARSETEVLQNNQAPKKNNGFVSKAMEYMFGW